MIMGPSKRRLLEQVRWLLPLSPFRGRKFLPNLALQAVQMRSRGTKGRPATLVSSKRRVSPKAVILFLVHMLF